MNAETYVVEGRVPIRAFRQLVASEAKLALRVPVGLIFGFAAPIVLLVIFGSIPEMRHSAGHSGSLSQLGVYLPILIGLVLTLVSLISLPTELADHRQRGYLRRFSTTPVAPSWLLAAQLVVNLAIALLAIGVIVVGSTLFFGVAVPAQPVGFVLAVVLAIGALFSLGLLVCAVVPAPQVAGPLGSILLFPLLFFAGMWTPRATMSPILQTIGDYTPLGAASQAMQDAMVGSFPTIRALLVMAIYAVAFTLAAIRLFRWE